MSDIIFWSFILSIIVGIGIPLNRCIKKYLYPEYQEKKFEIKNLKFLLVSLLSG